MALSYRTQIKGKLVDCYNLEWNMNGKSGVTPMVVIYDIKDRRVYQIPQGCEMGKCTIDDEYTFEIEMVEKYGKNKKKVIGVH